MPTSELAHRWCVRLRSSRQEVAQWRMESSMPNMGGCLCGSVRYETIGSPNNVTICYCHFCQRATGTIGMVQPTFFREKYRIVNGEPAKYDIKSGGSGKVITVNFCKKCGTKLHLEFERFPNAMALFCQSVAVQSPSMQPRRRP